MSIVTNPRSRDFVYRGNAVAAAGYLRAYKGKPITLDPDMATIHGESSLPVIGGISEASVRPKLPFREFIDYGKCDTFAAGTGDHKTKITIVASSVDRVRVTSSPTPDDEVPHLRSVSFRADRLSIGIRSVHPDGGEARFNLLREPETAGMSLALMHTNGRQEIIPLRLELNKELLSSRTYSDLQKYDEFRKRSWPERNGYIITSIVRRIFRGEKAIEGSVLRERGLGTIYFGEVLINDHNRRITLVRIEMGSDPEGSIMMAAADPNGIWR